MNIFGNRVFMIGDLVQYTERGGSERIQENIWEIIKIETWTSKSVMARVRLVEGSWNPESDSELGPGSERWFRLKDLKHVEEQGV